MFRHTKTLCFGSIVPVMIAASAAMAAGEHDGGHGDDTRKSVSQATPQP